MKQAYSRLFLSTTAGSAESRRLKPCDPLRRPRPAPSGRPGASPVAAAPTTTRTHVSGDADRKQVSITVYNQNFGIVREVRELAQLGTGRVALEFRDVAATIQPETVAVKSAGNTLRVLEQNYRFDLLTPQTLLDKYVGRNVRAYRYHEGTAKRLVDATILSVAGDDPAIVSELPSAIGHAPFPQTAIYPKPTLAGWWIASMQSSRRGAYVAQNLSWQADYVFVSTKRTRRRPRWARSAITGASYPTSAEARAGAVTASNRYGSSACRQ